MDLREYPPPVDVAKHYNWEGSLGCLSKAGFALVAGYLCALVVRWIVNKVIGVGPIDMWRAIAIVLGVGFLVGLIWVAGARAKKRPK